MCLKHMKSAFDSDQNTETHHRLLEAAGEVFAERGFRQATVREICKRAHANVAAINYHFHDKQGLYEAVLKYALARVRNIYPTGHGPVTPDNAEQELREMIAARLHVVFDLGRTAWRGKLMSRELIEPTEALDALVKEELEPFFQRLQSCVRAILGPGAGEDQVHRCAFSISSQWVFYHYNRQVISRLDSTMRFGPEDIDALADHIVQFSLAALRELKRTTDRQQMSPPP
ncbi:MAG: CerR family C-terminal domain-containing protein [Verrucomicrobiia bacterium]